MNPAKVLLVTLLAGTLSIGIALYGEHWLAERGDGQVVANRQSDRVNSLPDIRLPDIEGREIASNSWAGKVVILNFWATWCTPCLREMPVLAQLQNGVDAGRLQIVGIAIDNADSVGQFLEEHSINYQILLGDADSIALSKRLGNRTSGLPFTVVFDRQGRRVYSHAGEISAAQLLDRVVPLLGTESG
ncbi:MAG: TlpA disulfide reductase family protein [Thiohalocapsa sp.]